MGPIKPFLKTDKVWRDAMLPIDAGIVPLISFSLISKVLKAARFPMSSGIPPVKALSYRKRVSTRYEMNILQN